MMLTLNLVSGLFVLFNFVFCRVIFKIDNDILKRIRIKTHIITNSNIFVSAKHSVIKFFKVKHKQRN